MRIAVLSDVHAVAAAYGAALAAARNEGFDVLVILGDLLTYGVEPLRTLDLTGQALSNDKAVLILGNHDQLYLDRGKDDAAYAGTLPDWIRESVDWTCDQIDGTAALERFDWNEEWTAGPLLIAHANPFGYGDWRYLAKPEQMQAACVAIAGRGFGWGLFGHTHRFRRFAQDDASLVTVGSLGQPRDRDDNCSQWAMVELSEDRFEVGRRRVALDRDAHLRAIRATALSQPTKDRLCGFFP